VSATPAARRHLSGVSVTVVDFRIVSRGAEVVERLNAAMNAHDLDSFVACFDDDYESEQPVHPDRTFRGAGQVRSNWSEIFEGVSDFRSELV
jgi:hypothetical protein